MSAIVEWENAPPTPPKVDWERAITAFRRRPGKWGRVGSYVSQRSALAVIAYVREEHGLDEDSWQMVARQAKGSVGWSIYARYLPVKQGAL